MVNDYETHGLANALNMAYRLGDRQMYEAVGMAYHPGVSVLSDELACARAYRHIPSRPDGDFFNTVIDHVEDYHRLIMCSAP